MHYTATATTGAAQSGLGSSTLLGGERDKSALLTKQRSSSNVRLGQKETPPAQCSKGTGLGVRSFQPWTPVKVPKAAWHRQGVADAQVSAAPGMGRLQVYSWCHGGSDGEGSAPHVSLAEEHPRAGDGRWLCWLAGVAQGGHGSAPGSGSPSCEMKAETILQEIK